MCKYSFKILINRLKNLEFLCFRLKYGRNRRYTRKTLLGKLKNLGLIDLFYYAWSNQFIYNFRFFKLRLKRLGYFYECNFY